MPDRGDQQDTVSLIKDALNERVSGAVVYLDGSATRLLFADYEDGSFWIIDVHPAKVKQGKVPDA